MFDFHEKRKIRQIVYSKVFIGSLLVLSLLIAHSAYERFRVERDMALKRDEKAEELLKLKERASVLESKISHLENERGIEAELRSRFDVAKEGEQVVVILDEKATDEKELEALSQPPGVSIKREEKKGFLQKILDVLNF